ncbi:WD40 repeat-like protein, partial [Rhizoctonia solani]
MSSTPRPKRGPLDFLAPKTTKRPRSRATTPEPASGANNLTHISSASSSEVPHIGPAATVSRDMSTSPPPPIEDSPMQNLAQSSHHEATSATGSGVKTSREKSADGALPKRVSKALKVFRQGVGLFPPLQVAVDDVISCLEALEIDPGYKTEYEELLLELETLSQTLANHVQKSNPAHMSDFITRMKKSITEQMKVIEKKRGQPIERNIAKAEQDQREVLRAYHGIERAFRQLQADATMRVWSSVEEQTANNRLKELSPSKSAVYNSTLATEVNRRSCTEHTRTQILLELDEWSADSQTPNIYWMSGMAGTGKTTIAYTFAETLRKRGLLGASFFCTRRSSECHDVGRIIPTITYQLARYSMSFQTAVVEVLGRDPDIGTQAITEQCERLIKEPLDRVKDDIPDGLVVVIDALDECNSANGVGTMLDVLFRVAADLPVKFFVTSRPEPDIRHRIESQSDRSRSICRLHDIEESLVQADIELYIRDEFANSTVSESEVSHLARLSGCLFIYAATSIRYIRRKRTMVDRDRLEAILGSSSKSGPQHVGIDRLYTTILEAAIGELEEEPEEQDEMCRVLWTAVCTREPVDVGTLAALTGIKPTKADMLLQSLYSVLHVSERKSKITTLHASFPDFMFDKTRSTRFYCNEAKHSQLLAERCFKVMEEQLRFNICGLESSFVTDSQVENIEDRITRSISPALSYTAHYWGDHVVKSTPCDAVRKGLEDFLSYRLLFWMEVMSLKRTLDKGISMLSALKPWLTGESGSSDLMQSLNNSWIFVSKYAAGSGLESTPHIYISALAFCHHSSLVHKQYWGCTWGLLCLQGSAIEQSQSALLATWPMRSYAHSLAFSPDGSRFAVGFLNGTVCVLHGHSGAVALGPLEGRTREVNCVAFSPDGSLLASGSGNGTVIVRDAQTGNCMYDVIRGHESRVMLVCFLPNGKHLLSGSTDKTTQLWDSGNGSLIPNSIKRHHSRVKCMAFSPDGKHIACGLNSHKSPIVVYNAFTGKSLPFPFNAHPSPVESIVFSPNSKHLVTVHQSGELCVWSLQDGTTTHSPPQAHNGRITSAGFLPLGDKLVTASQDRCLYIWDAENGYSNPCLLGTHDRNINSVAFSPDGTRVASCSQGNVKMWNALHSTSSHTRKWKTPINAVHSVAILPDGSCIAAAGGDKVIYMFGAHDGTPALKPLVAHTHSIKLVAFSSNGRYLASGGVDGICLWDGASGKLLSDRLGVEESWVDSISLSPNSRHIFSTLHASHNIIIRVWEVDDGILMPTNLIGRHKDEVKSVAFSPDGKRVASGCSDGRICMWDSKTLSLVINPFGSRQYTGDITSMIFLFDGRLVASGFTDGTICIFDSHSGALLLCPLKAYQYSVGLIVFSPNSYYIVSGSHDGSV